MTRAHEPAAAQARTGKRAGLVVALLTLSTFVGLALAVSASGGDPASDNLSSALTATSPTEEPSGSPDGADPGTDPSVEQPAQGEVPPRARAATPAEVRMYAPPGDEDKIVRGVIVSEDPTKIEHVNAPGPRAWPSHAVER